MKNLIFALVHVGLVLFLVGELAAAPPVPDQTVTQKTYAPDQVKTPRATPDQVKIPYATPDQTTTKVAQQCVTVCPGPYERHLLANVQALQSAPHLGLGQRIKLKILRRKLGREIGDDFPPIGPRW